MASFEEIRPFIEAKVATLGAELFDVRFFGAGQRSVLRVTIDKDGGVSVNDCEAVSKALGELLDEREFFDGKPYTLEVSSPGIDRTLKTERDFKRIVGRDVTLHLSVVINGKKSVCGTVLGCADGILSVDVSIGTKNQGKNSVDISLADILSGREEIRFK